MDAVEKANATRQKKWIKEQKVGEGTYAVVYQGREANTTRKVAIKKIKVGQFKDGLDMSAVREVKYLKELKHQNVIADLKPNNLLIASDGQLKIADFGLARDFADPGWYRPPELLFGCRYYSTAVDIWSVGCIFAELMLRIPYLPGESDMDQLKTIFRALGTPSEDDWPGHTKLPDYVPVGQFPKSPLRDLFTAATADALNLLSRCLIYEPRKRISCKDALNHAYFFALPYPTLPSKLPKTANQLAPRPLEEVDGNVDQDVSGPAVKAMAPNANRLKRKASITEAETRSVARRLDFTSISQNSP
ncbi:hypothetical protein EW145_g1399 [Phellinidium pouzarii]|uniref:[RNA-polymerase]-subunit kinase n=1 Tax=Phellinidium pouzarii TaxID=167371 RepID=A0A4S4LEZ7_9AGAM|nr:hypothetical protein EW145_g1399 [Phellinidium pouzarii]